MAVDVDRTTSSAAETVFVNRFCDGIIGPGSEMLGPVRDGGHIVANTAPGCWGPMITPAIKGGHEVTLPVAVEGAEVGDAIVIRIRDITVTSLATASGNDRSWRAASTATPTAPRSAPGAGRPTRRRSSRASARTASAAPTAAPPAAPFAFTNGYTIAFDEARGAGRDGRPGAGRAVRPRRRPRGRAARELDPEPDPALRPARPRRRGGAPAALHGPARHDARRRPARLAQRGRLRLLPARRARTPGP